MRICAIVNVWADSIEFLPSFFKNMIKNVDGILVIASTNSNYGENIDYLSSVDSLIYFYSQLGGNVKFAKYTPTLNHPMHEETKKRNFGLDLARIEGYTHFITCDTDEFYDPEQFLKEKQRFIDNPDLAGLVCASRVYVKSPSLTIGLDTTRVPFIHKITPTLKHEFNRSYPFAWEGKAIRIDPTRSLNINSGVEWSDIVMDHYSWVRSDIQRKIRNSTAKANIERTNIAKNFFHLKEGDVCELYPGKPLVRVQVKYGLPEFYGSSSEDLQSIPSSCE